MAQDGGHGLYNTQASAVELTVGCLSSLYIYIYTSCLLLFIIPTNRYLVAHPTVPAVPVPVTDSCARNWGKRHMFEPSPSPMVLSRVQCKRGTADVRR